jgi:succinate dehydrogenase / fumarate reductase, cytochrome b subunit
MVSHGLRSVVEVARYRGRFGQLDWMAHRLSGLGVLLFLLVHIVDTATVYFAPAAYDFFLTIYKNPIVGLTEIALAGAVIYHAFNGLRVVIMDFWPRLWEKQPQARRLVWLAFLIVFIPTAAIMFVRIVQHALPSGA